MKQRDIANFEANLQQFYAVHHYEPTPILEAYLLSLYPRDQLHSMPQEVFDHVAVWVFENIDRHAQVRMQQSLHIATGIMVNLAVPCAKKLTSPAA